MRRATHTVWAAFVALFISAPATATEPHCSQDGVWASYYNDVGEAQAACNADFERRSELGCNGLYSCSNNTAEGRYAMALLNPTYGWMAAFQYYYNGCPDGQTVDPATHQCITDCSSKAGQSTKMEMKQSTDDDIGAMISMYFAGGSDGECSMDFGTVDECYTYPDSADPTQVYCSYNMTYDGTEGGVDQPQLTEPSTDPKQPETLEGETEPTEEITETDNGTTCYTDGTGNNVCEGSTQIVEVKEGSTTYDIGDGYIMISDPAPDTNTTTYTTTETTYPDGTKTIEETTQVTYNNGGTTSIYGTDSGTISSTTEEPSISTSTTTTTTAYDSQGNQTNQTTSTTGDPDAQEESEQQASADGYGNADWGSVDGAIDGWKNPDSMGLAPVSSTKVEGLLSGSSSCDNSLFDITLMGTVITMDICYYIAMAQTLLYWVFAVLTVWYIYTSAMGVLRKGA